MTRLFPALIAYHSCTDIFRTLVVRFSQARTVFLQMWSRRWGGSFRSSRRTHPSYWFPDSDTSRWTLDSWCCSNPKLQADLTLPCDLPNNSDPSIFKSLMEETSCMQWTRKGRGLVDRVINYLSIQINFIRKTCVIPMAYSKVLCLNDLYPKETSVHSLKYRGFFIKGYSGSAWSFSLRLPQVGCYNDMTYLC